MPRGRGEGGIVSPRPGFATAVGVLCTIADDAARMLPVSAAHTRRTLAKALAAVRSLSADQTQDAPVVSEEQAAEVLARTDRFWVCRFCGLTNDALTKCEGCGQLRGDVDASPPDTRPSAVPAQTEAVGVEAIAQARAHGFAAGLDAVRRWAVRMYRPTASIMNIISDIRQGRIVDVAIVGGPSPERFLMRAIDRRGNVTTVRGTEDELSKLMTREGLASHPPPMLPGWTGPMVTEAEQRARDSALAILRDELTRWTLCPGETSALQGAIARIEGGG